MILLTLSLVFLAKNDSGQAQSHGFKPESQHPQNSGDVSNLRSLVATVLNSDVGARHLGKARTTAREALLQLCDPQTEDFETDFKYSVRYIDDYIQETANPQGTSQGSLQQKYGLQEVEDVLSRFLLEVTQKRDFGTHHIEIEKIESVSESRSREEDTLLHYSKDSTAEVKIFSYMGLTTTDRQFPALKMTVVSSIWFDQKVMRKTYKSLKADDILFAGCHLHVDFDESRVKPSQTSVDPSTGDPRLDGTAEAEAKKDPPKSAYTAARESGEMNNGLGGKILGPDFQRASEWVGGVKALADSKEARQRAAIGALPNGRDLIGGAGQGLLNTNPQAQQQQHIPDIHKSIRSSQEQSRGGITDLVREFFGNLF